MNSNANLGAVFLVLGFVLYFIVVVYFSRKKNILFGLSLPAITFTISLYFVFEPMFISNPPPTMENAIYMQIFGALSLFSFIVFGIVRYRINKK